MRQALAGFGLTDVPVFHRTEHSKRLIELHLRGAHGLEEVLRESRGVIGHLSQPRQYGIRVDLKHPSYLTTGERSNML